MASDRVLIVRIAGIGLPSSFVNPSIPLTLTSRAVPYITSSDAIFGVVTDLSAQFSSEIPLFGAMGSDPTTSFSVLANTQTLAALMARGAAEVRDANNGSVQTIEYVTPSPTPTIKVTDSSYLYPGDRFRINGCAYEVVYSDNSAPGTLSCIMRHGSAPQPIPVRTVGEDTSGSTLYAEYWNGADYPTGGAEQQPVTISTNSIDAPDETTEEVIFRGVVSRVSIQTSAGLENQIRVECMSLLGVIKNAPWAPAPSGLNFRGTPGYDRTPDTEANTRNLSGVLQTNPNRDMMGPIWEFAQVPYDTRYGTMQVRQDTFGGVTNIIEATRETLTLSARPVDPNLDDLRAVGFNLMFRDGYYRVFNPSNDDDLNIALSEQSLSRIRRLRRDRDNDTVTLSIDPAFQSEIAFSSASAAQMIVDLICGTVNVDTTGVSGSRAWGMAAWVPFDKNTLFDFIDIPSLITAMSNERVQTDLPVMNGWDWTAPVELPNTVVLPVKAGGPKTVGEVLEFILKNLGCFMTYDRGRITFGRWASENPWPTAVTDADFAEPKISLNYDRSNAVQQVSVEYPATITADALNLTKNPIANIDRITTGAGKTVTVGSMMQQGSDYQAGLINSFAFQTGTTMVTRYSQAAATVELSLRDDTKDLALGQYVALTTAFIPNGAGSMGVANATGIVLKVVRSWQTPTSSYTLFLPGYLFAANRISQVSCSAKVVNAITADDIEVEYNEFTLPFPIAPIGAPTTDTEAFQQLGDLIGFSNFYCELFDQFGTPLGVTDFLQGTTPNHLLFTSSVFGSAVAGDIILISDFSFIANPGGCWDAFQAGTDGNIYTKPDAYPWVR